MYQGVEEKQREAGATHATECSEWAPPTFKGYPELIDQGLEGINEAPLVCHTEGPQWRRSGRKSFDGWIHALT